MQAHAACMQAVTWKKPYSYRASCLQAATAREKEKEKENIHHAKRHACLPMFRGESVNMGWGGGGTKEGVEGGRGKGKVVRKVR